MVASITSATSFSQNFSPDSREKQEQNRERTIKVSSTLSPFTWLCLTRTPDEWSLLRQGTTKKLNNVCAVCAQFVGNDFCRGKSKGKLNPQLSVTCEDWQMSFCRKFCLLPRHCLRWEHVIAKDLVKVSCHCKACDLRFRISYKRYLKKKKKK